MANEDSKSIDTRLGRKISVTSITRIIFPSGVAKKYVDTNLVNTQQVLERTDCSDQSPAGPKRRLVRSVTPIGQTGWMQKTREDLEPQARRSGVVLRSAGHS